MRGSDVADDVAEVHITRLLVNKCCKRFYTLVNHGKRTPSTALVGITSIVVQAGELALQRCSCIPCMYHFFHSHITPMGHLNFTFYSTNQMIKLHLLLEGAKLSITRKVETSFFRSSKWSDIRKGTVCNRGALHVLGRNEWKRLIFLRGEFVSDFLLYRKVGRLNKKVITINVERLFRRVKRGYSNILELQMREGIPKHE